MKKIRLIVLAFVVTFLLNGCIPILLGGAAATLVVYDKRSFRTIFDDSNIKQKILVRMRTHPDLEKTHVGVAAMNYDVLLIGQVRYASQRITIQRIARNTPKVKHIYNAITVSPNVSTKRRAKDSWITSNVKSDMIIKPGLRSGEIKAVTENGIVYLMGRVSRYQARLATNVARRVSGVKKVVTLFKYDD
ncbi:MAG: BON domain-containing protein [Pseudomonadota bacterium]